MVYKYEIVPFKMSDGMELLNSWGSDGWKLLEVLLSGENCNAVFVKEIAVEYAHKVIILDSAANEGASRLQDDFTRGWELVSSIPIRESTLVILRKDKTKLSNT